MQNVPSVAVPLDPLASYIYTMYETSCTCLQPRPSFAWMIIPLYNIIFPIIDQWFWSLNVPFYEKKRLYDLFSWIGLDCLQAWMKTNLRRRQFTFYHKFSELVRTHFLSTSEGSTTKIPKSDPKKGVSILM